MTQKRLLVLGITGIDRREILRGIQSHCADRYARTCKVIDFENDHLFSNTPGQGTPRTSFLDARISRQRAEWNSAWERFVERIQGISSDDLLVGMHGCYIRGHYGCRPVPDVEKIARDLRPDLIITLIADVYDLWWRTESRAQLESWKGRPTLEQLLLGRRMEVAVGDSIALAANCRHLVLAVGHPRETLARTLLRSKSQVAYLSFPISEPRRMMADGDSAGVAGVNAFIHYAYEQQKSCANLSCVCPLAIDELPFRSLVTGDNPTDMLPQTLSFDRAAMRWNLDAFWPENERLGLPPPPGLEFPVNQILEVQGNILSDVGWRDYRLVEQADCLLVYNPVFNQRERISRGVLNEITFATRHDLPVYIFQEPEQDQEGTLEKWLSANGAGTMGENPSSARIIRRQTLEELFQPFK